MRKIVGYLLMSLDGVVEEPFDWIEHFDEDASQNMVNVINAQDAVLLGRVTYQEWAAYWTTASDKLPFTAFINNVPKYVVSTTLNSVDLWQPATRQVSPHIVALRVPGSAMLLALLRWRFRSVPS